jgi:hypothetical protein
MNPLGPKIKETKKFPQSPTQVDIQDSCKKTEAKNTTLVHLEMIDKVEMLQYMGG